MCLLNIFALVARQCLISLGILKNRIAEVCPESPPPAFTRLSNPTYWKSAKDQAQWQPLLGNGASAESWGHVFSVCKQYAFPKIHKSTKQAFQK